nr:phage tail assembly chaperone [Hyphomonadaceae bacterium]
WPAILGACLRIGIPPHEAWCLSLSEWRALTGPSRQNALPRTALDALIQRFPDIASPDTSNPRTNTP